MDLIDQKIIALIQEDARITVSELSKLLALSRPSTAERLVRLQERGIIEAFTARISLPAIGREIMLIIQVSTLKVPIQEFEAMVQQEQAIIECHRVTGEVSYFLKAAVSDMNGMTMLIDRLIPFGNINTSTVLTSPVPYRVISP
ncbi:Lrp/AsnC family transcriptional regulator [Alkalicoccobacillus murimartini]|uniref:Lrp/AsnC family leucine-responsive transcriptional regulator n=1 Tax=Alkalicoccobacillus murimartini TaxID=171685 RepID=A0ABT9YN65_9BACI|nr:Lrp/AsnC family transcriptional regulator [Alkalicoccobacillus murimartini]MDQ0209201.1 Lrp/AsnC family leucine-responsive transcriptional regulator [Alkalicoccobacillus murimartini]